MWDVKMKLMNTNSNVVVARGKEVMRERDPNIR